MSEREQLMKMINGMPEYKIAGILAFLPDFLSIFPIMDIFSKVYKKFTNFFRFPSCVGSIELI